MVYLTYSNKFHHLGIIQYFGRKELSFKNYFNRGKLFEKIGRKAKGTSFLLVRTVSQLQKYFTKLKVFLQRGTFIFLIRE